MTTQDGGELLARLRHEVSDAGRLAATERAHRRGRLTARERIDRLCDPDSFHEYGSFAHPDEFATLSEAPADGLVTGSGTVDSRPVVVAASDYSVAGGSDGKLGIKKLARVTELALRRGLPLVMLLEGGGHRITEGLDSRTFGQGAVEGFEYLARLSGWAPIVCGITGPGFAGPANYSAFADLVLMVKDRSAMGLAGPALVKAAIGEDLDKEELGGTDFHVRRTGMADIACADDEDLIDRIKVFLSYLPTNASQTAPTRVSRGVDTAPVEALRDVIPASRRRAYDVKAVVELIVDDGECFELHSEHARNAVTGLARIDGKPVGMVANNPKYVAGALDAAASEKIARFVTLCSAYGIPVVALCDTPGFMVGTKSEQEGVVRRSAKLIHAIAHSTVPLYSVVLRKGYGLGWNAMGGGRAFGSDVTLVWPTAEIVAMSIEGAVDVAMRREWEDEAEPEKARQAIIDRLLDEGSAVRAAAAFTVDELIDPADTRSRLIKALRNYVGPSVQQMPPKRHGIPPL